MAYERAFLVLPCDCGRCGGSSRPAAVYDCPPTPGREYDRPRDNDREPIVINIGGDGSDAKDTSGARS